MTQTMTQALLSVNQLKVAYPRQPQGDTFWAVDDVSFELKPGEKIGLVGESGLWQIYFRSGNYAPVA